MPVVGTAGHVDHGKSTLVQALTGRDPDRWAEEKARGLTIDLGFAWTTLPGGTEISFVDVPGHEKFIKNMLAGTDGFDVALFVVAADEGWMPQSEEHLAVLDLLGIGTGVVALTKLDRVDEDLLELATLDVEEHLDGTAFEGATIVPVSAVDGTGLDELRMELERLTGVATHRATGRPRMWIDRSFTISGAGTVVTGTLTGAPISVGDHVDIWPGPLEGRVRSLQSHEATHDTASPGTRVAANIVGLEREAVGRGAMLGAAGQWAPGDRLLVAARRARYIEEALANRGAYHLHLGSGAWPARLRTVGVRDETDIVMLHLEEPVPVVVGDRFILREVGKRAIVAGGRILDPASPRRSVEALAAAEAILDAADTPDAVADVLLSIRGSAPIAELAAHTGGGTAASGTVVGDRVFATRTLTDFLDRAEATTRTYHADNPLRPGIPKASLGSVIGADPATLEAVLSVSEILVAAGSAVSIDGFAPGLGIGGEEEWARVADALRGNGLAVPRIVELDVDRELLHALQREERVVRISDELVYLPEQLDEIRRRLTDLPDEFTVADFRDAFAISRKYAVPLLEWFDKHRVTVRRDDIRTLRERVT